MDIHANGFHMNPIRAHLYTAWELEFQRQLYFCLKQPQVYLYKPEHWSYKHIVAISRNVVGHSGGTGNLRRALLQMPVEGVQLTTLPLPAGCACPHRRCK